MKYYVITDEIFCDIFCNTTKCSQCSYKDKGCKKKVLMEIHKILKDVELKEDK